MNIMVADAVAPYVARTSAAMNDNSFWTTTSKPSISTTAPDQILPISLRTTAVDLGQ